MVFGKQINVYDNVLIYQADGNSLHAVVQNVQPDFIRIKVTINSQSILASLPEDTKLEADLKPSYFESIQEKVGEYGRVLMFLHENISIVSLFQGTTNCIGKVCHDLSETLNNHIQSMENQPVHSNSRFLLMNLQQYIQVLPSHQLARHLGIEGRDLTDVPNVIDTVSRQLIQTNTTLDANNSRFGQFGTYDRNFNICFNLMNTEAEKLDDLRIFFKTQHGLTSFYTYYCGLVHSVNSGKLQVIEDEYDEKLNTLSDDEVYDVVLTQDEKPEVDLKLFSNKNIRYLYLDSNRAQITGLNAINPAALKTLVLRHCQTVDLTQFTNLENLLVSTVPNFDFTQLRKLTNLKTLVLKELLDKSFGFYVLEPLKKLKNIQLNHVEMGNIDVIDFPMPELEVLEIQLIDSNIKIYLDKVNFKKIRRIASDATIQFIGQVSLKRLEDVQLLHPRQKMLPFIHSTVLRSVSVVSPIVLNPQMLLLKSPKAVKLGQNFIDVRSYQANGSVCLNRIEGFSQYLQQVIKSIRSEKAKVSEKQLINRCGRNVEIQMRRLESIL